MQSFPMPSHQEIRAAYAQGEQAVIALFQRTAAQLAARLPVLEDPSDPHPPAESPSPAAKTAGRRPIQQGDIYWVPLDAPPGVEPGITHPHVVIQENVLNRSRVHSVVVCALTSNQTRANLPGNVLLDPGEANLPRPSVVEVAKVSAVDKTQLGEYIGSLSPQRIQQILAGMHFLQSFTQPAELDP